MTQSGRQAGLAVKSALAVALAGCAAGRPGQRLDLDTIAVPHRFAVLFLVDGLAPAVLDEMAAAGRLATLKRCFIDGGVGVDSAIASVPSITYPNMVSLITGRFPGHHGVLGNRWYDPVERRIRDYGSARTYQQVNRDFTCPTLFDLLGDRHFTVSVQSHTRRGVTVAIDHRVSSGLDWLFGNYSAVDGRVGRSIARIAGLARREGRWPSVILQYFPGVDEIGHRFGPASAEYHAAIETIDAAVGETVRGIEAAGILDRAYLVLTSDHGLLAHDPKRCVDVLAAMREAGVEVSEDPTAGRNVAVNGAFRRVAVHFDRDDPNRDAEIRKATTACLSLPSVGTVCRRADGGAVHVNTKGGRARISRRQTEGEPEYLLEAEDGTDPFGYRNVPDLARFIDEGWHGSRAWLAATVRTDFPDFVPQVVEMFDSRRAGDLVLFAADDWSFRPATRGGHGSCLSGDMRVPLYFTGPGLRGGATIPAARTVDLVPTVLDLLGAGQASADAGQALDGASLATQLEAAGDPAWTP